ncbi:hypothetical protein D3C71_1698390 [compost metagenome]
MFDVLKGEPNKQGKRSNGIEKGKFVLDLIYSNLYDDLEPPLYIEEGLSWLENVMNRRMKGTIADDNTSSASVSL